MALNWTPLAGNFNDTLYNDLLKLEAPLAGDRLNGKLVKVKSSVNFTIGIGFDLVAGGAKVQAAVFKQLGLKAGPPFGPRPATSGPEQREYDFAKELVTAIEAHKGSTDLNAIMARRVAASIADSVYADYLGSTPRSTFIFADDSEVRQVFDVLWPSIYREMIFTKWPELRSDTGFASSKEMIVLASMTWNSGTALLGDKLRNALQSGNRAEAWFEIRYGSNGGSSPSSGIAKRRYVESQLFSLYDNPTGTASADEAKNIFVMLTQRRDEILRYESKYGVPPDGTKAATNTIALANGDPDLSSIAIVQSLVQALTRARTAFIAWANTQLPAGEAPLVAAGWNPAAIFYNDPSRPQPLDARSLDGKAKDMDKNLLVGNDSLDHLIGGAGDDVLIGGKGNDTLLGGAGDDTLYGGEGDDTYVIDLRDGVGHDRVVDSDGKGRIVIYDATGNAINDEVLRREGTADVWTSKDSAGNVQATIAHDTTWRLALADGSVIDLGDNFVPASFGISLLEAPAATTTTFTGGSAHNNEDRLFGGTSADLMQGLLGNDLMIGLLGDDRIDGGLGDDLLLGGLGADTIQGGDGADWIYGSGWGSVGTLRDPAPTPGGATVIARGYGWVIYDDGARILTGEVDATPIAGDSGNIIDGGAGADVIHAGTGSDVAHGGDGNDGVYGLGGNDVLYGDGGDDVVWGDGTVVNGDYLTVPGLQHGNDVLLGGAGTDYLYGQGGNDEVYGGSEADYLFGDSTGAYRVVQPVGFDGSDYLDGGDGDDYMDGGGKDDTLYGGNGADTIFGDGNPIGVPAAYQGNDYLDGEAGDDTIAGGGGDDKVFGGADNDQLWGDDGSGTDPTAKGKDYLDGEAGDDEIVGGGGDDEVIGGADNDRLWGDGAGSDPTAQGRDHLDGGDGDDQIVGGGNDDTLLGGAGVDRLFGDDAQGTVALALHGKDYLDGQDGNDQLTGGGNDDELDGGDGDDVLRGDDAATNVAASAHGNDTLYGGAGQDTLIGDGGDDTLLGGDGNDFLVGEDQQNVTSLSTLSGNDTLYGEAGSDTLVGGNGNDLLDGGDGADDLYGGAGNDTLLSGDGDDWLDGESGDDVLEGGLGRNIMYGHDGNDVLRGGGGDDTLYADGFGTLVDGNDTLEGGDGADWLYGYGGDDTLDGGTANDRLYSDAGNDTIVFGRGSGSDVASDSAGSDRILLGAGVLPTDVTLFREHSDLVVVVDQGATQIRVAGHFMAATNMIETIAFSSGGAVWDAAAIASKTLSGTPNAMVGTAGNDTFVVDDGGDTVTEGQNNGVDTVQSWVAYELGANLENLTLTGYLNVYGWGNELDNVIDGNAGDNEIYGGLGRDAIAGGAGDDRMWANNLRDGSSASDDGRIDTLLGGIGNDSYNVATSDEVIEAVGEGFDTVNLLFTWSTSGGTYSLAANVENLNVVGGWTSYDAIVNGNASDNVIAAKLYGRAVDLDGGVGADTLIGNQFGGTYYVDNVGDVVVVDTSVDGIDAIDTINSSIDWTLDPGQENLELSGTSALHGIGTDGANVLWGNFAASILEGLGGSDTLYGTGTNTLIGGAGDDTYHVEAAGVTIQELAGGGADTVVMDKASALNETYSMASYSNVENMSLSDYVSNANVVGDGFANRIVGNFYANRLDGGGGNDAIFDNISTGSAVDTLLGGAGNDSLTSYGGADLIDPGTGSDVVTSNGDVTVIFSKGYGADRWVTSGAGANRRVLMAAEVSPGDLQITRTGVDLRVGVSATDKLTVAGFFPSTGSTTTTGILGRVQFADGTALDSPALVKRMLSGNSNVGTASDDVLLGFAGSDVFTGLAGNDFIVGSDGDDALRGDAGSDSLFGGQGSDTYRFAAGDGQDTITEAGGASDVIEFGAGVLSSTVAVTRVVSDLRLSIGTGSDQITLRNFFASAPSQVEAIRFVEEPGTVWGVAQLMQLAATQLGTSGDDVMVGFSSDDSMYGLAGNDRLDAGIGNDLLDGGLGNDTMIGGIGNDTYVVDSAADTVVEQYGSGSDTVLNSVSYVLPIYLENITLTGTAPINATGNWAANVLIGNEADNVLDGASGADAMTGRGGNDTYMVDDAADSVVESVGEGIDLAMSSVTRALDANVENLTLTGTLAVNGTGNELDNLIVGNAGANTLDGGTGNDSLAGGAGNDIYFVDSTADVVTEDVAGGTDSVQSSVSEVLADNVENLALTGSSFINASGNDLANTLTGNSGANVLDGGAGIDSLIGGAGDDTFVVDEKRDVITERFSEGIDLVRSSLSWTLGSNLENLALTGIAAINATGNTMANVLTGNGGANVLDGDAGADTMAGGAGDDTYIVDRATDVVTETESEGTDTIQSSVKYTLGANVENLLLTGADPINGTGNALDNTLTGNSGANVLDGGAGADTLAGGFGDDTYVVDNAADIASEGLDKGTDLVQSSVSWTLTGNFENLTLVGTAAINGTGNGFANVLTGSDGANVLDGGSGTAADTMLGGAGDDIYVVDNTADVLTEGGGKGLDLVQSSVSWTLGDNFENLTLTGGAANNATGNTAANVLTGNTAANVLVGGAGTDTLIGEGGSDAYDGGAGNDVFTDSSTTTKDTYLWGGGLGVDSLTDSGGSLDHVDLFAGIAKADLKFVQNLNNLELSVNAASGRLVINNWFGSTANQIEEFRLADGSKVLASEVAGLLSAMASFSAPDGFGASAQDHRSVRPPFEHVVPNAMFR